MSLTTPGTDAQSQVNGNHTSVAPRDFSLYDDLRRSPTASFRPAEEPEPSIGRTLHIASDRELLGSTEAGEVTLCHMPIFLRYSMYDPEAERFRDVSSLSYGGTAGALLAMYHFNNGDGSIAEELGGINETCDIRFTTEVIDTQSSQIVAVQNLAHMITHRRKTDIERPQPCAAMGAAWYTLSQSMATVTGVYDLLQVSPSSSSMSLDSMSQFPLFARTHPSDEAKGTLAVEYFDGVLRASHFGILFVNSEMGISLQKKIMDAAVMRGMTARSVAFNAEESLGETRASLRNSLLQLSESGFNYFLGVFFPLPYEYVMEVAAEVGVAGPGKFWLLTGHQAETFAFENTTMRRGSDAAIGSTGIGILHDDGGDGGLGLPQYAKFARLWYQIQHDQQILDYINSKQPEPPEGSNISFTQKGDYFKLRPSHYSQFSYDAIAGMGIAACRAANQSTLPDNYFTGKEHHETLINHPFIGATGNVRFANDSFSRDGYSVYTFVSEIREIDRPDPKASVFSGTTSMFFDTVTLKWKPWPGAREFVYSDGSTVPPPSLPPYSEDTHSLTTPVRAVCLSLAMVVMLTSVGLSVFVFVKRKNQVITASQPPFLYILCTGTLVMSSSIIPLTIDDSIADEKGCSTACMSRVWLLSIGFTITFSALFSKTWRINKLVRLSRGFMRLKLKVSDVMVPFVLLFMSNVLILSLWTALAPLQWSRTGLRYDQFGRQVESVGGCSNKDWLPYGIALMLVNSTALVLAIVEAYKAREITTEFSESKYIAMAMVCIFQAMFFGVPLLFLTLEWPVVQSFVMAAVIFIICMAVLLLIFVPKILLIRKGVDAVSRPSDQWLRPSNPSNTTRRASIDPASVARANISRPNILRAGSTRATVSCASMFHMENITPRGTGLSTGVSNHVTAQPCVGTNISAIEEEV